jgi:PAS domain S-box-containing protein
LQQSGLLPTLTCIKADGAPLPREELPDQQALRSHQAARNVMVGLKRDSDVTRWLLINSVPLPVGPSMGPNYSRARVVSTFADITEQVKANERFRQAIDKYQTLVETLPFMLQQCDRELRVTYLNPAAKDLTGYAQAELMAPGFIETLIHPDDLSTYRNAHTAAFAGQTTRLEFRLRDRDGSVRTLVAFVQPNHRNGDIVGSTSVVIDITPQRRLEVELEHARHLELVGRLASGTVHDLNNLLAVILGLVGLVKTNVGADSSAQQHLTRIEDVGEQAAHLTGQLLAFGKKRAIEKHPVDLNTVVTQTVRIAQSVLPPEIVLHTELCPGVPMVMGDENRFKQIVMNLCINARDAMTHGGTLTIRTDVTPPPGRAENGKWVRLSIQDTGHGMEENVRARIFEPFFSTKERGTGLGLVVVEQIVKEYGGRIDVWSQPGQGTRIDVWFISAV